MLAIALTWTGVALELATLAALVHRRRLRRVLMLPVLLTAILVATVVPIVWPAWNTWHVWLARELTHAALALLLGAELALRLFLRRPRARREARQWIAPALLATVLVLLLARAVPPMSGPLPLLNLAMAWLYTILVLVARHHLIPVDPLHKTVLYAFTVYLLVYALGWTLTGDDTRAVNLLNPIAFNLLMLVLLRAAWRDDSLDAPEDATLYYWPWRRFERPRASDARGRAAPVGERSPGAASRTGLRAQPA